jgi:hypothetical protein
MGRFDLWKMVSQSAPAIMARNMPLAGDEFTPVVAIATAPKNQSSAEKFNRIRRSSIDPEIAYGYTVLDTIANKPCFTLRKLKKPITPGKSTISWKMKGFDRRCDTCGGW